MIWLTALAFGAPQVDLAVEAPLVRQDWVSSWSVGSVSRHWLPAIGLRATVLGGRGTRFAHGASLTLRYTSLTVPDWSLEGFALEGDLLWEQRWLLVDGRSQLTVGVAEGIRVTGVYTPLWGGVHGWAPELAGSLGWRPVASGPLFLELRHHLTLTNSKIYASSQVDGIDGFVWRLGNLTELHLLVGMRW